MEFAVLCGCHHQRTEACQGAAKDGAGEQVGLARQLRELYGAFGGMEQNGDFLTVQFSGDADQGELVPGM